MKSNLLIVLFFILPTHTLLGQKSILDKIDFYFLVGYQVGGQGENRNFVTKSGINLQVNALYELNKNIHTGIGFGYSHLKNETYIPFFLWLKLN